MSNSDESKELKVCKLKPIRLKDVERPFVPIIFERDFGFIPEAIIIEKVPEISNTFVVNAVLTKEEAERLKKEEEKNVKGGIAKKEKSKLK